MKKNIDNIKIKKVFNSSDIVPYVDDMFNEAIKYNASDIHIEPTSDFVLIRFRQDGDFVIKEKLTLDIHSSLITRLKVLAKLKIDENKKPQDGKISYKSTVSGEDIDVRVSTLPTTFGEKVVMRLLRQDDSLINIDKLGFLPINLDVIKETLKGKYGIILVAGPTGSGKSTTIFGLLKNFDPLEYNISTLEDPVEYNIDYVNQSQVKPEIGYTFATGLRSLVRQDPDIMMVGEIRDRETASLSIEAALTGHLVFSTIHTNSASATIQRLINMGIDPFLITSSLKMVISQRLVKKVCQHCKTEAKITEKAKDRIKKEFIDFMDEKDIDTLTFYKGSGCEKCGDTGYKGRLGVHEVMELGDYLEKTILDKEPASAIHKLAKKHGMITILQDALLKASQGHTTIEEVLQLI